VLPSSSLSGLRPSNLSASFQVVPALFHGPAPAVHVLLPEQKPSLHLPQDRPPLVSFRVQRVVNTTCKHHACLSLRAHEQAKILLQCTCEQVVNAWVSKQDISFTKIITRLLFFSHVFNLEKPCALNHAQTNLLMSSLHHRSCSELVRLSIHASPTKQAGGHKS